MFTNNTIRNNLVTIDKNYFSSTTNKPSIVRNDDVLHLDEHNSRKFATTKPLSSFPHLDLDKYSSDILPCTQIKKTFRTRSLLILS